MIAAALGICFFLVVLIAEKLVCAAHRALRLMSVVQIKEVTKQFGPTTALQSIELEIQEREFLSLIGPSGCGKSTLLRIIGDLIQPTSGTALVNGKSARQARIDRDYGIVFQDAVLYDWRTVAKNISLPLELARWGRKRRSTKVEEMLELVELVGFESHYPGSSPAGCSSAFRSRERCRSTRLSSSWTSRSVRSTR